MSINEAIENIGRNAWNWDLQEFCRRLGLNPDGHGQAKFRAFNEIVNGLGEFDREKVEILFADHRKAVA